MEQYRLDVIIALVDRISAFNSESKPENPEGETQSPALRIAEAKQQVEEILNECLESVSYSILGGEYILDPGTEGKLDLLIKKLGTGGEELEILDDQDTQELRRILREEFYGPLGYIIRSYQSTIVKIQRKYTFDRRKSILGFETSAPSIVRTMQTQKFQITQIILRTIELDHLLSLDRSAIQELLDIWERLSSKRFYKGFAEAEIALEKTSFLIRKVVMRMDHKGEGYYFTSNLKQVPFELRSFETETKLQWDEDASIYYELHNGWKKSLASEQTSGIKDSFKEKIFSIKTLRQTGGHDLGHEFAYMINETKEIKGSSFHHLAAQKLLQNYFTNCQFSHIVGSLSPADFFEEVEELLAPVRITQVETVVLNFHPFKKATSLALEYLKKKKPQSTEEINHHNRHLRIAEKLLHEYEDRLEWCKTRQFSEFLLPPEECFIIILERNIFIASSMSLPIDYEKEKNILFQQKESLHLLVNQERINQDFVHIERRLMEAQKNINEGNARMETSQLRMVELLGLFTTLFTIVASSLNFFGGSKFSPEAVFPFILVLTCAVAVIMGLVMLVVRGKDLVLNWVFYLGMLAFVGLMGIYIWKATISMKIPLLIPGELP